MHHYDVAHDRVQLVLYFIYHMMKLLYVLCQTNSGSEGDQGECLTFAKNMIAITIEIEETV